MNNRHIQWAFSGGLLCVFLVFMGGYFVGQKKALEKFYHGDSHEQLIDSIASSLSVIHSVHEDDKNYETVVTSCAEIDTVPDDTISEGNFYAQLIGFATEKAAERFAHRLTARGIPVLVQTRMSTSMSGALHSWYQVVTQPYANKKELTSLVASLIKEERLHDVRIVSC